MTTTGECWIGWLYRRGRWEALAEAQTLTACSRALDAEVQPDASPGVGLATVASARRYDGVNAPVTGKCRKAASSAKIRREPPCPRRPRNAGRLPSLPC